MQTEGRLRVNTVDWLSLALVIIGAINWGLVGLGGFLNANWNVVELVLGTGTLANLVYLLVGVAGLYELYFAYQLYSARGATGEQVAQ